MRAPAWSLVLILALLASVIVTAVLDYPRAWVLVAIGAATAVWPFRVYARLYRDRLEYSNGFRREQIPINEIERCEIGGGSPQHRTIVVAHHESSATLDASLTASKRKLVAFHDELQRLIEQHLPAE
jgi:hypothetical protein